MHCPQYWKKNMTDALAESGHVEIQGSIFFILPPLQGWVTFLGFLKRLQIF